MHLYLKPLIFQCFNRLEDMFLVVLRRDKMIYKSIMYAKKVDLLIQSLYIKIEQMHVSEIQQQQKYLDNCLPSYM